MQMFIACVFLLLCLARSEQCEDEQCAQVALLQIDYIHRLAASGKHHTEGSAHEDHSREQLRTCVNTYADGLDGVVEGLGSSIREHPLTAVKTTDRRVVLGPGSGTTGTESCAAALGKLGLKTSHAGYGAPGVDLSEVGPWTQAIWRPLDQEASTCIPTVRQFDYTTLPESIDALVDTPMAEQFINLFLSFPNAKFVMTVRPPVEWAERRLRDFYQNTAAPMQEPCGLKMGDPRLGGNDTTIHARLFELNNDFIRCAVPEDRLYEIDVFSGPTDHIMLELSQFLELPPLDTEYPHCVGGDNQAQVPIEELRTQATENPECPLHIGAVRLAIDDLKHDGEGL